MPNYNTTLQTNNSSLEEIITQLNNMPDAGGEQATPAISVNNSNGLITATAGSKSSTYQLAFQAAKTITPKATSQIAVSSGYYTGGNVTVAGDANLVAGNIKSGTSIFGITGTYVGSGGSSGDTSVEDSLVTRTVTSYENDRITNVGSYAFYHCSNLTSINFPNCTDIRSQAFYNCYRLTSINFPNCTSMGYSVFYNCSNLTSANFPNCTSVLGYAFYGCSNLTNVSFPKCTYIGNYTFAYCYKLVSVSFPKCTNIEKCAFYYCSSLTTIYLTNSIVCALSASNAFMGAGIWSNKGSIFVPASLVSSYKSATNWTYFSNRIFAMPEQPNIPTDPA